MNHFFGALGVCADGVRRFLAWTQRSQPGGRALALAAGVLLSGMGQANRALAQAVSKEAAPAVTMQESMGIVHLLPQAPGRSAPELFGFTSLKLGRTLYDNIWREAAWSAMPVADAEVDDLVARLRDLPVRKRAELANAWINGRVSYAPDRFIANHHWGNLAKVLTERHGEREDIGIAKLQLLAAAGIPRSDMYLVLVQDWWRVAEDYLLVVRDGDQVYVLDSKQDRFEDPSQTSRYVPLLAFSSDGGWIFGRRRRAGVMSVSYASLQRVSLGYSTTQSPPARIQPSVVADRRR